MYQTIMWKQRDNVKGVARGNEPTENYHLHLQLHLTSLSFIVSFSLLFSCSALIYTIVIHGHRSRGISRLKMKYNSKLMMMDV